MGRNGRSGQREREVTADGGTRILIPEGAQLSSEPVEGGVTIIDASIPAGEPGHVSYRTLSPDEQAERSRAAAEAASAEEQARANRVRAEAHHLLRLTAHLVAADEPDRDAWVTWREQVRAVPDDADPDDLPIPPPPSEIPPDGASVYGG